MVCHLRRKKTDINGKYNFLNNYTYDYFEMPSSIFACTYSVDVLYEAVYLTQKGKEDSKVWVRALFEWNRYW